MVTINMSEFQEAHTVSTLKGSPPGYVGYGEGGVLTEAVRRRPYSVVLLDEVEKAHPDVLELFFQVFDKGQMEDGEGREIDFKNTIIILTSNAGTDTLMKLTADPETMPGPEGLVKALKPELNKIFKPAFLGRLVIIPYFPIRDEALKKIIMLKLGKIQRRIKENHKIDLTYDDALIDEVARRCTEVESGARNVDNILTNTLLPEVSKQILAKWRRAQSPHSIRVSVGTNGSFCVPSNCHKLVTRCLNIPRKTESSPSRRRWAMTCCCFRGSGRGGHLASLFVPSGYAVGNPTSRSTTSSESASPLPSTPPAARTATSTASSAASSRAAETTASPTIRPRSCPGCGS